MKMRDDKEASKMEAYLKFFAEYFDSKNKDKRDVASCSKTSSTSPIQLFFGRLVK